VRSLATLAPGCDRDVYFQTRRNAIKILFLRFGQVPMSPSLRSEDGRISFRSSSDPGSRIETRLPDAL